MLSSYLKRFYIALIAVAAVSAFYFVQQARDEGAAAAFGYAAGPMEMLEAPYEAPAIGFVDGSNRPLSLADFRGRVVLLNIWASWCLPCREEMPSLDRLQASMGGDDFSVVAISTDMSGIAGVERFYRSAGIDSLGIYLDQDGQVASALQIPGLPATFLIDRDGKVLGVKLGPAEWDSDDVATMIRERL